MPKKPKIRVIALALIEDGDRIFLSEGYDSHTQQLFYRALGGGVEFGETSKEALKREFLEELQAELTDIEYLGCLENLFTFNNQPGHEIIQLYRARFVNPKFYQQETIPFQENKRTKTACWMNRDRCKSGDILVVPSVFLDYL